MIAGYFALLDEKALDFEVIAFANVGLHSQSEPDLRAFENRVLAWPLVRECYMLSGETDFILKCVAPDLTDLSGLRQERADGGAECGEREDHARHPPRQVRAGRADRPGAEAARRPRRGAQAAEAECAESAQRAWARSPRRE